MKIVAGNSSGSRSSRCSGSVVVIWPLANVVVLLMGLDSSALGINALSRCTNTTRPQIEYLLTRRQMLGKGARD
jgi:hypothetical protein